MLLLLLVAEGRDTSLAQRVWDRSGGSLPFYRVCHSSQHYCSEEDPCSGEEESVATLVLEIAFNVGENQL